jgi:hypothetical protein
LPKTGSTSLAAAFSPGIARHEGFHQPSVSTILNYLDGELSITELEHFLKRRQALLRTQVDAATFLHWIAAELQQLWPDALFLVVMREPCAWVCSYLGMLHSVNQQLHSQGSTREISWSERYGRYQAPSLSTMQLDQILQCSSRTQQLINELIQFWIERHHDIVRKLDQARLIRTSLDQLPAVLPCLASRLQLMPTQLRPLPQLNSNPAAPGLQQWLAQQTEQASRQGSAISDATALYEHLLAG